MEEEEEVQRLEGLSLQGGQTEQPSVEDGWQTVGKSVRKPQPPVQREPRLPVGLQSSTRSASPGLTIWFHLLVCSPLHC